MPTFIRAFQPGGTFFFTVVTYDRRPLFRDARARQALHTAFDHVRALRPFELATIVLLPDHLHCLWTLPQGDHDFSTRWRKIKEDFTRSCRAAGGREADVTPGQHRKALRGVWQPRFWEHAIRNERDFEQHVHYIHHNPIKHGCVRCAHAWPWSSFHRWVTAGLYEADWCCCCQGRSVNEPRFDDIERFIGE